MLELSASAQKSYIQESILSLFLVLLFFLTPFYIWLLFLLFALSFFRTRSKVLSIVFIFSIALLISSRYVGELWGGSDDMASYLLMYDNLNGFASVIPVSLRYGKNIDLAFGYWSFLVSSLSDGNRFIYYFSTVFLSQLILYIFYARHLSAGVALLALLLVSLFFKTFQLQWNIIRASLALPILLMGIYYVAHGNVWKGRFVYFIGFLFHASSGVLLFPILLLGTRLCSSFRLKEYVKIVLLATSGCIIVLLSAYLFGGYVWNKIISQSIQLNFSNVALFLVCAAIGGSCILTSDDPYVKNMLQFLIVLSLLGFVFGKNFYRFMHPLMLFMPIAIVHISRNIGFKGVFRKLPLLVYSMLCYATFFYVVSLDESRFFYLFPNIEFSGGLNGLEQMSAFIQYILEDIDYYDGYRT